MSASVCLTPSLPFMRPKTDRKTLSNAAVMRTRVSGCMCDRWERVAAWRVFLGAGNKRKRNKSCKGALFNTEQSSFP
jgi:hypothetical protein